MDNCSPETVVAHGGSGVDPTTGALIPPLHASTTFERDADGGYRRGFSYARDENPTFLAPESLLAQLEGGSTCLLFSSGMAAAAAVFQVVLERGDHVVIPRVMYWGLRAWVEEFARRNDIALDIADDPAAAIVAGRTRLVWIETPANPTWAVTDIAAVGAAARAAGCLVAVDNTVSTPILTRPLDHGADIVMHSATKYLNGHSDVVAGALVTDDPDLGARLGRARAGGGAVLGSFEAWLLLRGMRTLALRVERASASALALAHRLGSCAGVHQVLYPGLADHPGHAVAARQMTGGFGGMLSFRVEGGAAGALEVAGRLGVIRRATSLGGVESLIEHRRSIEGPDAPVPDDLLRLSVGIESADDLFADLEQALGAG